jgi:RNA polymerase sigma-70 factor (ECF subfamily)
MSDHERTRLRRAYAFDRNALAAVYDDYHLPIYRYIYRQVGDVETARDLAGEVFQRFLQAVQNHKGPDQNLKSWLYRTAHNLVIDYYRRRQHRQHLPLDEEVACSDDDPVRLAEHHLSAEAVRAALQHLTPDQQQVIVLKFLEGLSNQETAAVLNKPVGAVKSLQHRALAALQRHLAPVEKEVHYDG